MLRKVFSLELSSTGLSDAGAVGGVETEFIETVELAAEGAGETRYSVEPDDAEAIFCAIERSTATSYHQDYREKGTRRSDDTDQAGVDVSDHDVVGSYLHRRTCLQPED
jgi:hypothetical protein